MTLISTIITDAYRETNLIARGTTESTSEQDEALRLLDRYILALFEYELGDPLVDQIFGQNSNIDINTYDNDYFQNWIRDYYLPSGFRLKLNLDAPETIKLDPNPQDGDLFSIVDASNNLATNNLTIDGNGSLIEGVTDLVINTDGYTALWFYRADKANWKRVTDVAVTDESPFPKEFDDMLIIGLAMRLDPRNGAGINQLSFDRYQRIMKKFKAKYTTVKEMRLDPVLVNMDGRQRRLRRNYTFNGEFDRGRVFFRW